MCFVYSKPTFRLHFLNTLNISKCLMYTQNSLLLSRCSFLFYFISSITFFLNCFFFYFFFVVTVFLFYLLGLKSLLLTCFFFYLFFNNLNILTLSSLICLSVYLHLPHKWWLIWILCRFWDSLDSLYCMKLYRSDFF